MTTAHYYISLKTISHTVNEDVKFIATGPIHPKVRFLTPGLSWERGYVCFCFRSYKHVQYNWGSEILKENAYGESPLLENHQYLRIIVHKYEIQTYNTPEQSHIVLQDLIPITSFVDSNRIEDVQWWTTAEHYATLFKDSLSIKSVDFFYIGEMIASSMLFPDEDSTRIILHCESRVSV